MEQAPASLSLVLAASALLSAYVAGWSLKLRRRIPIEPFVALMASIAIYSAGAAVETSQMTVDGMLAAVRFEYVGLAFIPPLFLIMSLQLLWRRRVASWVWVALMIIPIVTLVMVMTMPFHEFFYVDPRADVSGAFPVLDFERGPWYLVNFTQQAFLVVAATVIMLRFALVVRRQLRWAALVIAVAASLPVTASLLYFLGWEPLGTDPVPLFLGISGVLTAIAVFGLNVFDLIPAARELALNGASVALLVLDPGGTVRDFNNAARELPGMEGLRDGHQLPTAGVLGSELAAIAGQPGSATEFAAESGEQRRHFQAMSYTVAGEDGLPRGVALVVQDITETKSRMDLLTEQATTDSLTGALSRRALLDRAQAALADARHDHHSVAVMMVDMDDFKLINDRYGHAAGDRALARASEAMHSVLRSQDVLGRWGGDEFLLILPNADPDSATHIARRLQDRFEQLDPNDMPHPLRASVGIAVGVPDPDHDVPAFIDLADKALYLAKNSAGQRISVRDLNGDEARPPKQRRS